MEPLLRGHPEERPSPLVRPLDNVNLNINVLNIYPCRKTAPLERPHFLCKRGGLTRGVPLQSKISIKRTWVSLLCVMHGWVCDELRAGGWHSLLIHRHGSIGRHGPLAECSERLSLTFPITQKYNIIANLWLCDVKTNIKSISDQPVLIVFVSQWKVLL